MHINPSIYNLLLQLPLFQGLGKDDLREIVGHTRFGFQKPRTGETIAKEGDPCRQLIFLLNGKALVATSPADHGYTVHEDLAAPNVLQPERIFGLRQYYSHTFIAQDGCQLLTIDKDEAMRLSDRYLIFRINLLNQVCALAQKTSQRPFLHVPSSLRERIVRFFEQHSLRPAGEKTFHIKMTRLALELNDSRLNISRELNRMQSEGLLTLSREKISIPALENLLSI